MKDSIRFKLESLDERYEEVSALLSDPGIISDQNKFRELSKEYAELEPVIQCFRRYLSLEQDIEEAKELLKDRDPEVREMTQLS